MVGDPQVFDVRAKPQMFGGAGTGFHHEEHEEHEGLKFGGSAVGVLTMKAGG